MLMDDLLIAANVVLAWLFVVENEKESIHCCRY